MSSPLMATEVTLVQEALENLAACAKIFADAQDERRIEVADDTISMALSLIAQRLLRASTGSPRTRAEVLRALADKSLQQRCEEAVEKGTHRSGPIHRDEFLAWLECDGI